MSNIKEFQLTSKPSRFPTSASDAVSLDMSIRIKNGVAVITGCSTSINTRRETANAVGQVSGVNQVIDLANSVC